MDEFEVWRPDADPEDESGFDAFSEEFLRLLSPGETADEAEDENAWWDDPDAEPSEKPTPDVWEKDVFEIEPDAVELSLDQHGEVDAEEPGSGEPWYDSLTQHPVYRKLLEENRRSLKKRLIRELKDEALDRIEFAARSMKDYEQIVHFWDNKDASAARTQRNHEELRGNTPMEWNSHLHEKSGIDLILPEWLNDPTWSQLRRGSFLDYLFDCPYEMHNLTSKEYLRRPVMELKGKHKEILYFLYLRLYSPQQLACVREQSDRNIRKVRDAALRRMRRKVYASLQKRRDAGLPLSLHERIFLAEFSPEGVRITTEKDGNDDA